jgi:hypothetical protein
MSMNGAAQHRSQAQPVLREFDEKGYVVFENQIPLRIVEQMRCVWEEYFVPFRKRRPDLKRFLMHVPFKPPLYDPLFVENPKVLQLADYLLGKDYLCGYFGSETPLPGASTQQPHFDLAFLSRYTLLNAPLAFLNKFLGSLNYCYAIQISVPLVDSTLDNAPFEIWPHTNRVSFRKPSPQKLVMPAGSILVRDIRNIHRGTAHSGTAPRPFLSLVYLRSWVPAWKPPEIPAEIYHDLPEKTRWLFRRASIGEPIPTPEAWSQRPR